MQGPASGSRGRRWAAVALGVAAALAAAEVLLRVTRVGVFEPRRAEYGFLRDEGSPFWYADPANPPWHRWDRDPYGRLPPGAAMTYALNPAGLRGPLPQPGRPCVLFVGDSFTFGEGVAEGDTFVARVGAALASRTAPAPVAVNAGVPGYGAVEEAARLPRWLAALRPRAVVVVVSPNDAIPLDDAGGRDDLLQRGGGAPLSHVAGLVAGVLERPARDRAAEQWYLSYYFGERRDRWLAAREALAAMSRAASGSGARTGVVVFPLLHRLRERPFAAIHDEILAACRAAGTPALDLAPAFAGADEHDLWLHPTDHHPCAEAHRIAAEAMTPFVESLLR